MTGFALEPVECGWISPAAVDPGGLASLRPTLDALDDDAFLAFCEASDALRRRGGSTDGM